MASLSAKLKNSLSGFHKIISEPLAPPLTSDSSTDTTLYWRNVDGELILDTNGNPIEVN